MCVCGGGGGGGGVADVLLTHSATPGGGGTVASLRGPHSELLDNGVHLRVPQGRHAATGPQSHDLHSR